MDTLIPAVLLLLCLPVWTLTVVAGFWGLVQFMSDVANSPK
ncbi:hypothetical protein [Melghirimyces algeriensis]|uniref:Uncharacterized protein n=1 Tax=Melghirimyces algeriensis TaxID=910412 RepID=A0A521EGI4_9BACL|nr:hypothetical protein [Melghirimyces algeriensis]SMO83008.1 hypothetical protein SAMN06264849_10941 [Melghirimyces algeriensis]